MLSLAASSATASRPPLASARARAYLTSMPLSSPSRNRRRASLRPARASPNDDGDGGDSRASSNSSASTTTATTITVVEERPAASQREGSEKATSQASSSPNLSSSKSSSSSKKSNKGFFGLGDLLGPIGLTIGGSTKKKDKVRGRLKSEMEAWKALRKRRLDEASKRALAQRRVPSPL
jgi:hypothetical protein